MVIEGATNVCVIKPVEIQQLRHIIHRMPMQEHLMLVRIPLLVDTIVN